MMRPKVTHPDLTHKHKPYQKMAFYQPMVPIFTNRGDALLWKMFLQANRGAGFVIRPSAKDWWSSDTRDEPNFWDIDMEKFIRWMKT
jgi:hypothetical protein